VEIDQKFTKVFSLRKAKDFSKFTFPNLIAFIVVACGGGGGGSSSSPVAPTPSNNTPMAGADLTVNLSEDAVNFPLDLSAPTDSDGDSLTISITAIPTSGSLKKADGTVLTEGGSLTVTELQALTFTPDANVNDSSTSFGSFSYSVSDGSATDSRTVTISVEAVNDAPDFGIVVTEFAPYENTTAVTTVQATDADGDAITYSITGGLDKDLFTIGSTSGELFFINAPDFENPDDSDKDNVYGVEISATDPQGAATAIGYVITVNDVNESSTEDNFKLSTASITLTDYLGSEANDTNVHQLYPSVTADATLAANLNGGTMDLTNLSNVVSSDSSLGKSPILSFKLSNVPGAGKAGTASITMKLFDGEDANQESGERLLQTTLSLNWSSDGSEVTVTFPEQTLTVDYFTADGALTQRTLTNVDPDTLTVTKDGVGSTSTLDLRITSFFSGEGDASGADLTGFITEGNYFFDVSFTGLNFVDSNDTTFSKIQGSFAVTNSPGIAAYVEDIVINEGEGPATIVVTLSRAASSEVTLDYQTANGTATAGLDFTTTSGTLTITTGDTSGSFTIPITDDTDNEELESFRVDLSNAINVTLGKTSTKVSIEDNESVTLEGNAESNTLVGGSGNDIIYGYAGADTLQGNAGDDTLYGGDDNDTLDGGDGEDTLIGGDGNDTIYGFAGGDTLEGNAGEDILNGGDNFDTLDGGDGNDILDGHDGKDSYTGGNGNDIFVIREGDGSDGFITSNFITDFEDNTDLIGLDNGLTFAELTIGQGTAGSVTVAGYNFSYDYTNHTLVSVTETGEYLFTIMDTSSSDITEADFTAVDIDEALANNVFVGILDSGSSDIAVAPIILKPTPGGFNQDEVIDDYGIQLEGEYEAVNLPEAVDKIQIEEGQSKQNIIDLHEASEILVDLPFEDDILVVSYDI